MSDAVTPVDAGQVAAGVAVGGAVWGMVRWLFTWTDRRAIRRDGQLQAWEDSLVTREKAYREEIERQLVTLHGAHDRNRDDIIHLRQRLSAGRAAVIELVVELRGHDPANAALVHAEQVLKIVFSPEHDLPGEFAALAAKLDAAHLDRGKS